MPIFQRIILFSLCCTCVAAAAPVSRPSAPVNAAEKAKKTAEVLVAQGNDALALGDFKAARDCFVDVLQVDARNRKALEGVGYAYLKLDDAQRAMRSLEGALAIPEPASRPLLMNLSAALVKTRNPMRGAKILRDYMVAHPDPVDEEMLNAFAICLGQASEEARVNKLFEECVKFYDQQNAKLEQARPGQKRWGVEWLDQSEWDKKDKYNRGIQKQMDAKWRNVASALNDYKRAKAAYDAASTTRFRGGGNLGALDADVRRAKANVDKYQGEYNEIAVKLERPTLPKTINAVALDDGTMLASARSNEGGISTGIRPPATPPQLSKHEPPTETLKPPPATPPAATTPPDSTVPPATTPPATTPPAVTPPVAVTPPPAIAPTPAAPRAPRTIFVYAAGFGVAPNLLITNAAAVEGASRITVQAGAGELLNAEVVQTDPKSGLALLRLKSGAVNYVVLSTGFAGGAVQCACFPTPTVFEPEPAMIAGSAGAVKDPWTIRLNRHPRLAGAPILVDGKVVGVVTAARDADPAQLPTATLEQVRAIIGSNPLPTTSKGDPMSAAVVITAVRGKQQ